MRSGTYEPTNVDHDVVADFGKEWSRFDQGDLSPEEQRDIFNGYFAIFPWGALPADPVDFDAGCGTGRWAALVAPSVKHLHCIDPSSAIDIARKNLRGMDNCSFQQATVDDMLLPDASMDFGYCLGVLHHVPDPQAGIAACVRRLKQGAPLLLYLYYSFDNRPPWFHALWRFADVSRRVICRLPYGMRSVVADAIAVLAYLPLARASGFLEKRGVRVDNFPLSLYRHHSFYSMRTDALDRFGTKLEQRFTQDEIRRMMDNAGLENIRFSPNAPYWCAVGHRKSS